MHIRVWIYKLGREREPQKGDDVESLKKVMREGLREKKKKPEVMKEEKERGRDLPNTRNEGRKEMIRRRIRTRSLENRAPRQKHLFT